MGFKKRIEVWFLNGTKTDDNVCRCFPGCYNVQEYEETYEFDFGSGHHAIIMKKNVLFIEIMDEK